MVRNQRSQSTKSPVFTLKYPSGVKLQGGPRVIISTKISKKATQRNRIRRRLKEAWRSLSGAHVSPPYIYVRKMALGMSFVQLKRELEKTLKRFL